MCKQGGDSQIEISECSNEVLDTEYWFYGSSYLGFYVSPYDVQIALIVLMQQVLDDTNNIASLPYISTDKREQFSDLFILNPISSKITPLMNILKTDYIIKTKIIENAENKNMNSKVNSNKLFNKGSNSNNNNSNSSNNLSDPGDIYREIRRTSVRRLLQGREGGHREMMYLHSYRWRKQEIAVSLNNTIKNLGERAGKDHLMVNRPSRKWLN